jgi:hypothetical protein
MENFLATSLSKLCPKSPITCLSSRHLLSSSAWRTKSSFIFSNNHALSRVCFFVRFLWQIHVCTALINFWDGILYLKLCAFRLNIFVNKIYRTENRTLFPYWYQVCYRILFVWDASLYVLFYSSWILQSSKTSVVYKDWEPPWWKSVLIPINRLRLEEETSHILNKSVNNSVATYKDSDADGRIILKRILKSQVLMIGG